MCKMTGHELKTLREAHGFSQSYVLREYQDKRLDKHELSRIENGVSDPTEALCIHVCKLCGFTVNETASAAYGSVATLPKGMYAGKRFNRLRVVAPAPDHAGCSNAFVYCICDCGSICEVRASYLVSGHTKSCGCYKRETTAKMGESMAKHGMWDSRLYGIWRGMKKRCVLPKQQSYQRYGGRGISVCEEWQEFQEFASWAETHGYEDDLEIDRIDYNGNYEPDNCRWVTKKAQARNRRTNRLLTCNGYTHTLAEWAEITGINANTISSRLRSGKSVEDALTEPVNEMYAQRSAHRRAHGTEITA